MLEIAPFNRVRRIFTLLGPCKLNGVFPHLERPFVRIVDAARGTGHLKRFLIIQAPCPKIVASLYQILENDIVIFGEIEPSITTFTMRGRFVEVQRYSNRHVGGVHHSNDRCSSFLRREDPVRTRIDSAASTTAGAGRRNSRCQCHIQGGRGYECIRGQRRLTGCFCRWQRRVCGDGCLSFCDHGHRRSHSCVLYINSVHRRGRGFTSTRAEDQSGHNNDSE